MKYSKQFNKNELLFPIKRDKFPDPRNWKHVVGSTILPDKVDLRAYMSPVKYQGALNSCSAFGVMASIEYWLNKNRPLEDGEKWDLSEMFQYYYCRAAKRQQDLNVGAYVIDAIKTPFINGYTTENYCPYDISKFTKNPGLIANISARFYGLWKPNGYYNVASTHEQIKDALNQGYPIGFGMQISENFLTYSGGVYKKTSGIEKGGHFMVICGYDDNLNAYIVKNSWSQGWGDKGYAYIDYNQLSRMFDFYYYK